MKHELKIEQHYLEALVSGEKTFEVRLNDRGYQKGDVLQFRGYNAKNEWTTFETEITYVHSGLGLVWNYVVLAVKPLKEVAF